MQRLPSLRERIRLAALNGNTATAWTAGPCCDECEERDAIFELSGREYEASFYLCAECARKIGKAAEAEP